jgi:hypothetical protein
VHVRVVRTTVSSVRRPGYERFHSWWRRFRFDATATEVQIVDNTLLSMPGALPGALSRQPEKELVSCNSERTEFKRSNQH